jgi:hypothetical protein
VNLFRQCKGLTYQPVGDDKIACLILASDASLETRAFVENAVRATGARFETVHWRHPNQGCRCGCRWPYYAFYIDLGSLGPRLTAKE